jgi:hypothetical protein
MYFRKGKKKKENHPPQKKFQKFERGKRDYSKLKCFYCEKMGHLARDCPLIKEVKERRKNKRHHAHIVEDDELVFKRERKEDSDEEYVLVADLTNSVNYDDEAWLVHNGASKHMTGFKDYLSNLTKKDSSHQVRLGDNSSYPIKGRGIAFYILNSGKQLKMENVLYVLGLQKNLLYISGLEEKGFRVAFVDSQVLMSSRGKNIYDVVIIGIHEDGLYKLKGKEDQALVHSTINPTKLWHRSFAHIYYKALPVVSKMVKGLPKMQVFHDGVCKGCAQGKKVKKPFPSSDSKAKGVPDLTHSDVCGPMSATSLSGYVTMFLLLMTFLAKLGFIS